MAASTSCLRRSAAEMRSKISPQASAGLIPPYQRGPAHQQSPHSQASSLGAAPSPPSSSSLPSSSASTLDPPPLEASSGSHTPTAEPSRPSHTCPHCAKSFSRPSKLQAHLLIHSDSRPHACSHQGCDAAYRTKSKLLDHERKSHLDVLQQEQEKKFVCNHAIESGQACGRRFRTNQHLLRHVEGVHDAGATDAEREEGDGEGEDGRRSGQYECTEPGCTQAFSKRKRLRRHVWEAHTDHADGEDAADADAEIAQGEAARAGTPAALRNKLPFPCSFPECTKRFPTNSKRKSHFKTHAQDRYTCALTHPTSSKAPSSSESAPSLLSFPTWSALQAHMREVHPPACHYEACNGKVFKNRENLKMHLRRHEEREHEEGQKEKGRQRDVELKQLGQGQGQEWCEASSDEEGESKGSKSLRVFHCTWRPETGGTNGNINGPTTTSTSTATLATSAPAAPTAPCSKSFKSSHSLQTHIRVAHLKDRPFKCRCGKAYGHKHLLKRHEIKCGVLLAEQQQRTGDDGGEEADGEEEGEEAEPALGSELDEDEEDDVFRQGGGALPEEYRESAPSLTRHPPARSSVISRRAKRKRGEVFPASDAEGEQGGDREGGPSIVDLLTGRGYANASTAAATAAATSTSLASSPASQPQKHPRRKRPRALPCPWSRLPSSPFSPATSAPPSVTAAPPAPVPSASSSTEMDVCPFHFARLYDVARHLRGAHGVEMSQGEVRGLYDEGELEGLPLPRGRVKRGRAEEE